MAWHESLLPRVAWPREEDAAAVSHEVETQGKRDRNDNSPRTPETAAPGGHRLGAQGSPHCLSCVLGM